MIHRRTSKANVNGACLCQPAILGRPHLGLLLYRKGDMLISELLVLLLKLMALLLKIINAFGLKWIAMQCTCTKGCSITMQGGMVSCGILTLLAPNLKPKLIANAVTPCITVHNVSSIWWPMHQTLFMMCKGLN